MVKAFVGIDRVDEVVTDTDIAGNYDVSVPVGVRGGVVLRETGALDLSVVDEVVPPRSRAVKIGTKLSVLLDWHGSDSVSAFEARRNERIFELRGSRNPFVAHPNWYSLIWC